MVQALDAERFHLAPPLNQIRVWGHSAEDKWFLPLLHLLNAGNTIRKTHLHDDMKNYGSETETMCPFSGKPLDTTTAIMLHRKVMWQGHKSHMVLTH